MSNSMPAHQSTHPNAPVSLRLRARVVSLLAWIVAAGLLASCTWMPPVAPPVTPLPATPSVGTPTAATPSGATTVPEALMGVHFLDVGQGDSTLIQGPDFALLIDAGRHNADDVVPHLERLGVTRLDLLIGTHPHADHIGQIDRVLARFPVDEVWMSGDEATTATYERILDALAASDAGYHEPRAGEVYDIGSAVVQVIHPVELSGSLDDNSISLRIVYGNVAFIFTGDAGVRAEQAMIDRGEPLAAQVLQLGHHGSRTSSGQPFLEAVAPQIAIWSAGAGNSFGHPHPEVVDRLACLEITVFGTADHGTISIYTEGTHLRVEADLPDGTRGSPTPVPLSCSTQPTNAACGPGQIDINQASIAELQEIVHIGPERAQMLIALRPYSTAEEMNRIPGIGPGLLGAIIEQGRACVGSPP